MSAQADPPSAPADPVPVYQESLGGALIDAARIAVMAALAMIPADSPLIVLPGSPEEMAEDVAANLHGCLEQAMQWLDGARALAMEDLAAKGAPPTSLHVLERGAR